MADVIVTNSTVEALNTSADVTSNAATETTADTAQTFVIKPTTGTDTLLVKVTTLTGVSMTVAAGDEVFANNALTDDLDNETVVYHLDAGRYINSDGEIGITFAPDEEAEALLTDAELALEVYEIALDTI